jgi:hypothetical protein
VGDVKQVGHLHRGDRSGEEEPLAVDAALGPQAFELLLGLDPLTKDRSIFSTSMGNCRR